MNPFFTFLVVGALMGAGTATIMGMGAAQVGMQSVIGAAGGALWYFIAKAIL